jgi:integrase
MGMNVQERSSRFQLRVTPPLLPRPFFHTFDLRDDAEAYGMRLLSVLASGKVPAEVMAELSSPKRTNDPLVCEVLDAYRAQQESASRTDHDLVSYVRPLFDGVRMSRVTYDFAVEFAKTLRVNRRLAPASVRSRVGLLGRVWNWHLAKSGQLNIANPWKLMPAGYSVATTEEQKVFKAKGKEVKRDIRRERRLEPGEEERILRVLAGEKLRADRERALQPSAELAMMYQVIANTGMRLRECYTLRRNQIDLTANVIRADGTKGHRGAVKSRDIPIVPGLRRLLMECLQKLDSQQDRLFPQSWDGSDEPDALKNTSGRLSAQFASLFDHAGCADLREHDLRHEATCRWVLMRDARGQWMFRDSEIIRMMGWTGIAMFLRYASLRAEDLGSRLYADSSVQ